MNLLRVSFAAAAAARNSFVSFNVNTYNIIIRGLATANLESEMSPRRRSDCVIFNTFICELCKAEALNRASQLLDHMQREKGSSTNQNYRILNEMFVNGFSPSSVVTLNHVFCGFLQMNRRRGDSVKYNTLINDMRKAKELSHAVEFLDHMWWVKGFTPNENTYTSLIHSLCKHDDRFDDAYNILNEMIVTGFSPSKITANNVLNGFLRNGEIVKANKMRNRIDEHFLDRCWMDGYPELLEGLADEVTYTSLMNAYFDEGNYSNAIELLDEMTHLDKHHGWSQCDLLPNSVIYSVFINGLDNKARTTEIKKYLLKDIYHYIPYGDILPTLEYHRTLVENCSYDEFKSMVKLVKGFCNWGLENAYETMLKCNYKPDGIVYNLFIIEYCKRRNIHQAYNIYKEMVHYGFACHMFTVFHLIQTLKWKAMFNELHWVIQNVLRSCNLNDYEILKFLNEFDPKLLDSGFIQPNIEALFNVLAEKAKDGLFLKFSYAPPSA